jgi:hypothetical protein
MKKLFILLIALCSFGLFAESPVTNVELNTLKIEKDVEKSQIDKPIENIVEIKNPTKGIIEVKLKLLHPQALRKEQHDISLEPYILGKETIYKLEPGETKKVNIAVKLPKDFTGTKYVFYSFDTFYRNIHVKPLGFEMLTYGQLTLSVKDTLNRKAELAISGKSADKTTIITVDLLNNGNTYIRRISATCLLYDESNKIVGKYPLDSKDKVYLFQTENRVFQSVIPKKLKGKYKVTVVFNNNDGNFNKVESKDLVL